MMQMGSSQNCPSCGPAAQHDGGAPHATGIIFEATRLAAKFGHKLSLHTLDQDPAEFLATLQEIIDAMAPHVAVLDEHGRPLIVNNRWKNADPADAISSDSAETTGAYSLGSGWKFLSPADIAAIANGIEKICSGETDWFQHAYWHDRPNGRTPEFLTISPFMHAGKKLHMICHYDMSNLAPRNLEARDWNEALLAAQAEERRRIARELHDDTAQNLLQIDFYLMGLEQQDNSGNAATYSEIRSSLHRVFDEIRTLSYFLHPPEVECGDLCRALAVLGTGIARRTGVSFTFDNCRSPVSLAQDICLVLYRVAQEAFANAHKHGKATEVIFRISQTDEWLALEIEDNGRGFTTRSKHYVAPDELGVGLSGMHERLVAIGGELGIRHLAQGTKIIASVPKR